MGKGKTDIPIPLSCEGRKKTKEMSDGMKKKFIKSFKLKKGIFLLNSKLTNWILKKGILQ